MFETSETKPTIKCSNNKCRKTLAKKDGIKCRCCGTVTPIHFYPNKAISGGSIESDWEYHWKTARIIGCDICGIEPDLIREPDAIPTNLLSGSADEMTDRVVKTYMVVLVVKFDQEREGDRVAAHQACLNAIASFRNTLAGWLEENQLKGKVTVFNEAQYLGGVFLQTTTEIAARIRLLDGVADVAEVGP